MSELQISTPYSNISKEDYRIEKRRLQLALLEIQKNVLKLNQKVIVLFEGRDTAGKGSTIKRFTEKLIPNAYRVVALGIPSKKESKYWFNRYEKHFPKKGEMVFFDRSWYTRALIEPTMGYCTKQRYKYFMNKVVDWEKAQITSGVKIIKIYLSINDKTQLHRLENRLTDPLLDWKFSSNDLAARKKWALFTHYKEQMFRYTSSHEAPWVIINANVKGVSRLTSMLYVVELLSEKKFPPLDFRELNFKDMPLRLSPEKENLLKQLHS